MYKIGRPRIYITLIAAVLFECAFMNLTRIGNVQPNLTLLVIIFISLYSDWKESLEAGIAGGILRGVISISSIGVNLIIFGLCGLMATYFKNKVYKQNFLTQIILSFFLAVTANTLYILARMVIGNAEAVNINPWYAVLFPVISASFYTSLFAPPVFFCLFRLLRVKILKYQL